MKSIERLMELEIEDLYCIIGEELHVGLGIDSKNNEVLMIRGKRWLKNLIPDKIDSLRADQCIGGIEESYGEYFVYDQSLLFRKIP